VLPPAIRSVISSRLFSPSRASAALDERGEMVADRQRMDDVISD
jgi:hypothetical protein